MSATYRYLPITQNGSAEVLKLHEGPFSEEVAQDEVLIDVTYSGINFADILMRLGLYKDAPGKPFVPGYELSGVVRAVGASVTRFKSGDKIMAGSKFGGYVSKIKLPEWQVRKVPSGLSLAEAAALPVNYITSYIALHEFGRIRAGDKVLIDCATGGVGVVFLQLCKQAGAVAVGLTSSPHKKAFIESFGATAYTLEEFHTSQESEFDFILNSSGGKSLKEYYKRLAKSGMLCGIGLQSAVKNGKGNVITQLKAAFSSPLFLFVKLIMDSKAMAGFNALRYFDDEKWMKKHLPSMETTQVKPIVGAVVPAAEAARAHQLLEQKQAKGKVVLQW